MAVDVVPGEGNENTDVVQQSCVVQQLAHARGTAVQTEFPGGIEKHEGKLCHVPGMRFFKAAQPRQTQHALVAHGKPPLFGKQAFQIVGKRAVAQSAA